MPDGYARMLERIKEARAAALRELSTSQSARLIGELSARSGLRVGDRVFDLVTGEEGDVLGGRTENVVVPTPKR